MLARRQVGFCQIRHRSSYASDIPSDFANHISHPDEITRLILEAAGQQA